MVLSYYVGNAAQTSGSRVYPAGYKYDGQGRTANMTNWTGLPSGTEVTTWVDGSLRGWLAGKQDNNGRGPAYTCTHGARLNTRTWARGTTMKAFATWRHCVCALGSFADCGFQRRGHR
jgi:hypothetical protein